MIAENDLQQYQAIFKAKFGQTISPEQAQEQGVKLLQLLEIVIEDQKLALTKIKNIC